MKNIYDQTLEKIIGSTKPPFLTDEEVIIPAYDGLSIANIPASICQWLGCPMENKQPLLPVIMDQFKADYDHIIFVLVDGLSLAFFKSYLETHAPENPFHTLSNDSPKNVFIPLTSIVPSTTSAALTTLWTGEQPIKHGVIGYELFLKEFGCITNMITHSPAAFLDRTAHITSAGFDPTNFLPVPTLGPYFKKNGISVHAFQHSSISGSGLSQMLLADVSQHAFRTESDLWFSVSEMALQEQNKRTFAYVYWGEMDTLSHRFGPDHPRMREEWSAFTHLLNQFISQQTSGHDKTLLLLSADHGQIATQTSSDFDLGNHTEFTDHLIMNPSGESRLPFLFVRKHHEDSVFTYITTHWDEQFNIIPTEEFIQSGLLGVGDPSPSTMERIGDYIVLPKKDAFWWWVKKENRLLGRHGGLSPEEMLVPFFAAEI